MRSRPAVSWPSGLPGMTTPFQRRTARRICIAYSARRTSVWQPLRTSRECRSPSVSTVACEQSDAEDPRHALFPPS
jgi:hypothetical protein